MAVSITLPENIKIAMPGDRLHVFCKLDKSVPVAIGTRFAFRESGKTVAVGDMTAVSGDTEEDVESDKLKELKKRGQRAAKKV